MCKSYVASCLCAKSLLISVSTIDADEQEVQVLPRPWHGRWCSVTPQKCSLSDQPEEAEGLQQKSARALIDIRNSRATSHKEAAEWKEGQEVPTADAAAAAVHHQWSSQTRQEDHKHQRKN